MPPGGFRYTSYEDDEFSDAPPPTSPEPAAVQANSALGYEAAPAPAPAPAPEAEAPPPAAPAPEAAAEPAAKPPPPDYGQPYQEQMPPEAAGADAPPPAKPSGAEQTAWEDAGQYMADNVYTVKTAAPKPPPKVPESLKSSPPPSQDNLSPPPPKPTTNPYVAKGDDGFTTLPHLRGDTVGIPVAPSEQRDNVGKQAFAAGATPEQKLQSPASWRDTSDHRVAAETDNPEQLRGSGYDGERGRQAFQGAGSTNFMGTGNAPSYWQDPDNAGFAAEKAPTVDSRDSNRYDRPGRVRNPDAPMDRNAWEAFTGGIDAMNDIIAEEITNPAGSGLRKFWDHPADWRWGSGPTAREKALQQQAVAGGATQRVGNSVPRSVGDKLGWEVQKVINNATPPNDPHSFGEHAQDALGNLKDTVWGGFQQTGGTIGDWLQGGGDWKDHPEHIPAIGGAFNPEVGEGGYSTDWARAAKGTVQGTPAPLPPQPKPDFRATPAGQMAGSASDQAYINSLSQAGRPVTTPAGRDVPDNVVWRNGLGWVDTNTGQPLPGQGQPGQGGTGQTSGFGGWLRDTVGGPFRWFADRNAEGLAADRAAGIEATPRSAQEIATILTTPAGETPATNGQAIASPGRMPGGNQSGSSGPKEVPLPPPPKANSRIGGTPEQGPVDRAESWLEGHVNNDVSPTVIDRVSDFAGDIGGIIGGDGTIRERAARIDDRVNQAGADVKNRIGEVLGLGPDPSPAPGAAAKQTPPQKQAPAAGAAGAAAPAAARPAALPPQTLGQEPSRLAKSTTGPEVTQPSDFTWQKVTTADGKTAWVAVSTKETEIGPDGKPRPALVRGADGKGIRVTSDEQPAQTLEALGLGGKKSPKSGDPVDDKDIPAKEASAAPGADTGANSGSSSGGSSSSNNDGYTKSSGGSGGSKSGGGGWSSGSSRSSGGGGGGGGWSSGSGGSSKSSSPGRWPFGGTTGDYIQDAKGGKWTFDSKSRTWVSTDGRRSTKRPKGRLVRGRRPGMAGSGRPASGVFDSPVFNRYKETSGNDLTWGPPSDGMVSGVPLGVEYGTPPPTHPAKAGKGGKRKD